ncbi:MAG TPA: tetratricopeptide repeat protein [Burkholderiales bacterium]|nr:tetratricopeptide repeat protein [Burkholderiales bacterium]
MTPPRSLNCLLAAAALAAAALSACAQAPRADRKDIKELNEPTLYEFLLGEIALQRGDAQLAAQTYLDLAKRTRDPRVARRAVEVASQARLGDIAIEAAKTWHDIEPTSAQALQITAALLVSAKRVEEAGPYIEKLLVSEGVNLENGFLQLNRLLSSNPDKAANARLVRKLAAKYPKLPEAHFAVGQAASAANEDDAALASARRAQELRPDWETAVLLEAQILQKKSPAAAAKRLGDYVAKNPTAADARLNYARALVLDKRYPEAREQFQNVLAASPGNAEVAYAVGVLAFQLKEYSVAEDSLKRVLGMRYRDPDAVRYLLGQVAEEQKRWPQAIQWYEQIQDGDHALNARLRTAGAMAKQGKLEDARKFLQQVATDSPAEEVQLTVAEAQLLRDANRHGDAFKLLGEALARQPEQPELLYDYALTAEKLERFDLLETNLRKLIEVRPEHAHAYNALGYSFAERNMRLPEARKLVEKAVALAPEDYYILDSLGWVQYREGDLKGAAATLRRAYTGRPDAEIGAHLGEVLWQLGQRDEARRVWQESVKTAPENETLLKTIKKFRP